MSKNIESKVEYIALPEGLESVKLILIQDETFINTNYTGGEKIETVLYNNVTKKILVPIMNTTEWKDTYNEFSKKYNSLSSKMRRKGINPKYLVEVVELAIKEERLFKNSMELNGRLYDEKGECDYVKTICL